MCIQIQHVPLLKISLRVSGSLIVWCVLHPTWNDDPMTPAAFFYGWIGHQHFHRKRDSRRLVFWLHVHVCLSFPFGAFSVVSMIDSLRPSWPIQFPKTYEKMEITSYYLERKFVKLLWQYWFNRDVDTLNVLLFLASDSRHRATPCKAIRVEKPDCPLHWMHRIWTMHFLVLGDTACWLVDVWPDKDIESIEWQGPRIAFDKSKMMCWNMYYL